MPTCNLPRLDVTTNELTAAFLSSPTLMLEDWMRKRVVEGDEEPWENVEREVSSIDSSGPDSEWDLRVARVLRRHLVLDYRNASDRAIWTYGTIVRLRDYTFRRWSEENKVTANRFSGLHTRNALARLWWSLEALEGDGNEYSAGAEQLFQSKTSRLVLQLVDCNPLRGRHWLARSIVDRWRQGELQSKDANVDDFFKALKRMSNVIILDTYKSDPDRLIGLIEKEVLSSK